MPEENIAEQAGQLKQVEQAEEPEQTKQAGRLKQTKQVRRPKQIKQARISEQIEQAKNPEQTKQAKKLEQTISSFYDALETTLSNYINMRNRIYRQQSFSELILIYYSFMLILNSLTLKYFIYNSELSSYFGIALSILILTYSLINNASGYAVRVYDIDRAILKLRKLRRGDPRDIEKIKNVYYEIMDNCEMREDIDFFETLCKRCRKFGCHFIYYKILFHKCSKNIDPLDNINQKHTCTYDKNLIRYFGEINTFLLLASNTMAIMKYIFLLILPLLMFALCVAPPEWLIHSLKLTSH